MDFTSPDIFGKNLAFLLFFAFFAIFNDVGHFFEKLCHFETFFIQLIQISARPDWTYEFPNRTGPDPQICWTGLNPDL